jgi:four helix bundle protein
VGEGKNIQSYQDLDVWQKAMDLVVISSQLTKHFPKSENFGLSSQLKRAAVSIPANIAEGRTRKHNKEFLQFLSIACGSLAELETHVQIAQRLNYIDDKQLLEVLGRAGEVGRMLNGLRRSIKTNA